MDAESVPALIEELRAIQDEMREEHGTEDIYSNSKTYEILIANALGHKPIPGHSGTRNGMTEHGEFEYKHYKESSSNHSWTFNDYSDDVITKLRDAEAVIFAHIEDGKADHVFDWYIQVGGNECADYLKARTEDLLRRKPKGRPNARRMINFSPIQLERDIGAQKIRAPSPENGEFYGYIRRINMVRKQLEVKTGIDGILTSNKLWESIVAARLGHTVLSEQISHDAMDQNGRYYEYKVAAAHSWNFQDISDNVLEKYLSEERVILAVVDKRNLKLLKAYSAEPSRVVDRLRTKLDEKKRRYEKKGKEIRRLSATFSKGDLVRIGAVEVSESPP